MFSSKLLYQTKVINIVVFGKLKQQTLNYETVIIFFIISKIHWTINGEKDNKSNSKNLDIITPLTKHKKCMFTLHIHQSQG